MTEEERTMLKKVADYPNGLISPADFFNNIGGHNSDKTLHKLISERYIEEVPHRLREKDYIFYRVSEKGHHVFYPKYKKILLSLSGDARTIVVSVITAVIVTILTIYITKIFE